MPRARPLREAFDDKYTLDSKSGCWLWTGATTKRGYGVLKNQQRQRMAHRIAYELFRGPLPTGLDVCHKCDTPSCVNPNHLFLGTRKDNMQDAVAKDRVRRGEGVPGAVLCEEAIRRIRKLRLPQQAIADLYGVSQTNISHIQLRKTWRHVSG